MRCWVFAVSAASLTLAAPAQAELIHYLGPHPVTTSRGRGMCHVEGPHIHDYAPEKTVLYVRAGVAWAFVGDPVEYDPQAPRHLYYGHHPAFWVQTDSPEVHYCYITGPHHHWYAPPPEVRFAVKGGAYWYVGPFAPSYRRQWRSRSPVDDYYASVRFVRPVVAVTPPEGFVGFYLGGHRHHGHGRIEGGVYLPSPRVEINIPVPSFGVVVGGGGAPPPHGVVYGHGHRRHRPGPPDHAPAWGRRGHKGRKKWK